MKKWIYILSVLGGILSMTACGKERHPVHSIEVKPEDTPEEIIRKAVRVVPTDRQYAWQKNEFIAFVHFGVNTFTGREWGTGLEDPAVFRPDSLDTDQWCDIIRRSGMKGVILTAKHHDGFCLWPSRYTDHSVKNCSPGAGEIDVVGALAASCRKYGLKLGVYLSPADLHEIERPGGRYGNGSQGRACLIPSDSLHRKEVKKVFEYDDLTDYDIYFMDQLYELLTEYGDIFEVWLDGANPRPGTGQTYNYKAYCNLIRHLRPEAVIAIGGPDVRWCGNEAGRTRESEFSVIPMSADPAIALRYEGASVRNLAGRDKLYTAEYLYWYPAETNTTLRKGWFYKDEQQEVKQVSELIDIWFRAVGGNSVLLLNLNPDRRGLIPDRDAARLLSLGEFVRETFAENLIDGTGVTASASRFGHSARKLLDGNENTCWMAPEGQETAELVVDLREDKTFNCLVLQEMIRTKGQRVESYAVDVERSGKWVRLTEGTTVGYKSIDRFPMVTARRLRVNITGSRICPSLSFMGIYKGPEEIP